MIRELVVFEHENLTSHFQVGTRKARRADGDEAEPSASCSLSHDGSGSPPFQLPREGNATNAGADINHILT